MGYKWKYQAGSIVDMKVTDDGKLVGWVPVEVKKANPDDTYNVVVLESEMAINHKLVNRWVASVSPEDLSETVIPTFTEGPYKDKAPIVSRHEATYRSAKCASCDG